MRTGEHRISHQGLNPRPAATAVALTFLVLLGAAEATYPPAASRLPSDLGNTDPIPTWTALCMRDPARCTVDLSEPAIIPLTSRVWHLLATVNRQVNRTIRPRDDHERWREGDWWALPQHGYGDCEDYQLLKRHMLMREGLPKRALRMTVVLDEERKGHAVLVVRTNRGDFILDNRRNEVLPWHQTAYIFIKRESGAGSAWISLGGIASRDAAIRS